MTEYYVIEQADGVYRQVAHPGYLDENGNLAAHNLLADRGYYLATDTPPTFDTRYQISTRNPSDQWEFDHVAKTCTVTYTVTDTPNAFSLYQEKAKKKVEGLLMGKLRQGVQVTVNNNPYVVQTRHNQDNINLLSVHSKASSRVSRNDTTPCLLRTQENVDLQLPPSEMVTVLEEVFDTQELLYVEAWNTKADIDNVVEGTNIVVGLDAIDSLVTTFSN